MAKYTIAQFKEQFPNDEACLHYLFEKRFGKLTGCSNCSVESKFNRVKNRRSYQCPVCSFQIYPTAGTIFHQSTTPLTYWFTAIYMFTTTRNGVAAKELERQLDVCYKTALRMAHQIKKLMEDSETEQLFGEIMVDETYLGMISKHKHMKVRAKELNLGGAKGKIGVFGMMQKNGKVITKIMGEANQKSLLSVIRKNVKENSTIVSDGYNAYASVDEYFDKHVVIDHRKGEYTHGKHSTNALENYWSTLKRMIKGTHIHVSKKHLPKYLAENTFRYVNRGEPEKMFEKILSKV